MPRASSSTIESEVPVKVPATAEPGQLRTTPRLLPVSMRPVYCSCGSVGAIRWAAQAGAAARMAPSARQERMLFMALE